MRTDIKKVLNGIKVVEQGTFITGPCCAMMLADLGADVIKIESPGNGDPYRSFKDGYYSAHFQAYNRNKRALSLDLKAAPDREVFYNLIRNADIYIQNFRPGAAKRFQADYETLKAINPALIYCAISGFGPDGPYAHRPVYDSVAQAVSGFLSVIIDPENPRFMGPALADAITGLYASQGIAAALVEKQRSGQGMLVEISMMEAMMHFGLEPFMGYFALGDVPVSMDRPRLAQAFMAKCMDGKLVAFHLSSLDKFWEALVQALGSATLADDPQFKVRQSRIANYELLRSELSKIFATKNREEWIEIFAKFDVPFAPVNTIPDVMDDPQVMHMGMVVPFSNRKEGAEKTIRSPYRFNGTCDASVRAAPLINQDSDEIRLALEQRPDIWPGFENSETNLYSFGCAE